MVNHAMHSVSGSIVLIAPTQSSPNLTDTTQIERDPLCGTKVAQLVEHVPFG